MPKAKRKVVVPLPEEEPSRSKCCERPKLHLRIEFDEETSFFELVEAVKDIVEEARRTAEIESAELELGGNVYDVE